MKVKISKTHHNQSQLLVEFDSPNGNGIALWNGPTPKTGHTLDVELDINETLSWQKNITPSLSRKSADHCYQ